MHCVWVVAVPGPVVVVPAGHVISAVQLALFSVEANVPAAQGAQTRSVRASPSEVTNVPTTHCVLLMQGVAGFESLSQVPLGHATGAAVSPTQEVPGEHAEQDAGVVPTAATVWVVPGGHVAGAAHCAAFALEDVVPASQGAHWRSTLELGKLAMCSPGSQSVQGAHEGEFWRVENVPDAQPLQVWSAVALPGVAT